MFSYKIIGISLALFTVAAAVMLYRGADRIQKKVEQERNESDDS